MEEFKTLFIPCTMDGLSIHSGSVMFRSEWVAKYWKGAQVYNGTQHIDDFQLIVFQKAYLTQISQDLIRYAYKRRKAGKCLMAFDLCDPEFTHEKKRRVLLELLPLFDFCVVPTEPLANWTKRYIKTYVVPDRVDLEAITAEYEFKEETPRLLWFGYEGFSSAVDPMREFVAENKLPLDVFTVEKPIDFSLFQRVMVSRDILLNPRPNEVPYLYKSDNKTHVAWACGLPVARDIEELQRLLDPEERRAECKAKKDWVREFANVKETPQQWYSIVKEVLS